MRGRVRGVLPARPQSPKRADKGHHPVAAADESVEANFERLPVLADPLEEAPDRLAAVEVAAYSSPMAFD